MVCAVAVVVYCAVAVVVIVFFLILHSFFSFFLATTEGFQGKEIDTTYFYTSIAGWDLRLALAIDQFDLVQTTMIPSAKPRSITTQLEDYLASDKNMALAHKMIPDLKFINDGNCKATGSSVDFSNCIPDEYCERVLRGETSLGRHTRSTCLRC